jgi:hypothetical protein
MPISTRPGARRREGAEAPPFPRVVRRQRHPASAARGATSTSTLLATERPPATPPFEFWGCSEIRESLGIRADSERHLMERLETIPPESIYYHSVRALLRRRVVPTPFPDDFATWVAVEVRDLALAERLAFPSPFDFSDIEGFREHLLAILDDHLSRLPSVPHTILGSPFYFLRGHLIAVPLDVHATDLRTFREILAEVDESSIYFHTVECMGRLGNPPEAPFGDWVRDVLGLPDLAAALRIDPFVYSLKQIRAKLLRTVDRALVDGSS